MNMLEIKGLTKSFNDKEVLKGIDLSVPKGSIFGFIGKNGAGKTTTMKAILGLIKADGGEIIVDGQKVVYGETATNRIIGYLPDVPEFYPFMTAREYLTLCGDCLGLDRVDIDARVSELLTTVGLEDTADRVGGFSRGMKQRLGIAQAIIGRPKLLICDEPTSALDPIGRRSILDILTTISKETTVLFSTHILTDVERVCSSVAFLNDGKICMQGSVAELKALSRGDEIIVETQDKIGYELIASNFPNATVNKDGNLSVLGNDNTLFDLLTFISENRIPAIKIERAESSLENIFMEVVK